ncbi:MAG: sialidase family protein [Candidatus Brocadiia bacterium]|nr:sialidase family protein [Candidatus Brocadiia bacterium]
MNGPTRLACCLCGLLLLAASCGKKEDKPRDESFIEAGAPVKISDLTLPGIVRDSEGALIVTAFIHSTFPSATEARDAIAVFRSEDKGATWEQVSTVPSFVTYGVWGYDLAIDESDSLYITWVAALYEPDSPQPFKAIMFSRSDDGGFSWTEPVRASDATTGQRRNPVIAAGGGNVYIAWLDGPDGRKTATEDVFFASSTDWGDSWSADTCLEIDLGAKDSASGEPSLCVAADGTVYCAYFSMRKAGNRGKPMAGFFLATSQDRGRSFSTSSHEAGVLRGLALVQKKNKLYLAAVHIKGIKSISTAETSQEIHLYVSDDGGEEWGKPVRIDDDPARERKGNLKLAVAGRQTLIACWDDARGGVYMAASIDDAESWGKNVKVAEPSRVGITPLDVAANESKGYFYLAVGDVRKGPGDATYLVTGRACRCDLEAPED